MTLAGVRVGFRPCSYDPKVFSPRVRAHLPCRYLSDAGVDARIVPVDGRGAYDVVVFQKAYAKADLGLATRLAAGGTRVVFDLCDNHFYNPEGRPDLEERVGRLQEMIDRADVVSVSTPEMAKLIDSKPAIVVDDALELPSCSARGRRRADTARRRRGPVGLVWQGQAGTRTPRSGMYSLSALVPVLDRLDATLPLQLTVIGNSEAAFRSALAGARFAVRYVPWRASSFAARFAAHDVCLIPSDLNPFTVCKSNNRPVLSLMLGVPVVADRIPSYDDLADFIRFADWAANIGAYVADPGLAARHVADGQRHIRATYTPERVVAQWTGVLRAALVGSQLGG